MSEYESSLNTGEIPTGTIRYSGFFEWEGLYKLIHSFSKVHKFHFFETKHKNKPPELEFEFKMHKRRDEYFMFEGIIKILIQDYFPVEVIKDGKKQILHKGRIRAQVFAKSYVYYNRWDEIKSPKLGTWLGKYFDKFIIKSKFDNQIGDENILNFIGLRDSIKAYLNMER